MLVTICNVRMKADSEASFAGEKKIIHLEKEE